MIRAVVFLKNAAVSSADSPLPIRNSPEGMSVSFMPIELVICLVSAGLGCDGSGVFALSDSLGSSAVARPAECRHHHREYRYLPEHKPNLLLRQLVLLSRKPVGLYPTTGVVSVCCSCCRAGNQ